MPQSIDALPNFSAASWTMDLLPSGTEEITLETSQTIGVVTSQSVTAKIYTITFPTYSYIRKFWIEIIKYKF